MPLTQLWRRSWTARYAAASLGAIILLIALAWVLLGFGALGLGTQGTIALMLGIVLTVGLAVGLMGLVFYSSRSGQDEAAGGDRRER